AGWKGRGGFEKDLRGFAEIVRQMFVQHHGSIPQPAVQRKRFDVVRYVFDKYFRVEIFVRFSERLRELPVKFPVEHFFQWLHNDKNKEKTCRGFSILIPVLPFTVYSNDR